VRDNQVKSQPVLFDEYPAIADKLPWTPIGILPTPVQEAPSLADALCIGRLFIKRDDLTHPVYGGNKVRKLEFVLADAVRRGYKKVITFGGIGSNQFLATTIHASEKGIGTIGVLVSQPVTAHVKHNLLCDIHYGAEMHLVNGYSGMTTTALKIMAETALKEGKPPYVIPIGGSSVSGVVGYVNAAFELKRQIDEGVLPEPDFIFVAVGTAGTVSGLITGCRAAGLKTRVIGVKVTDWMLGNSVVFSSLANLVSLRLFSIDRKFPLNFFTPLSMELLTDYFGAEYGRFTREGLEAIELVKRHADLELEGVYTGKAFAGLAGTARKKKLSSKTVLFWNTYNSADLSHIVSQHNCSELPQEFKAFFDCLEHTQDGV